MDSHSLSEAPLMAEDYTRTEEKLETRDRRMSFVLLCTTFRISTDRCDVDHLTIDMLPDNACLPGYF
jgi:hypothetical protein